MQNLQNLHFGAGHREPHELLEARRRLAEAEAAYRTGEGLARLEEGLALLDDVIEAARAPHAETAQNLARAYASRIYAGVERLLARERTVPEPELEHLFRVVLAFDASRAALPPAAAEVKVSIVRRLIDRYYEGYSPEQKRRALEELERIAKRE